MTQLNEQNLNIFFQDNKSTFHVDFVIVYANTAYFRVIKHISIKTIFHVDFATNNLFH